MISPPIDPPVIQANVALQPQSVKTAHPHGTEHWAERNLGLLIYKLEIRCRFLPPNSCFDPDNDNYGY